MKILWLSWKDRGHPEAGGAETVSGEIMDHLVRDGHEVTLLTAHYPGSTAEETSNGITIYRSGNRFSVYLEAKKRYKRDFQGWPDIIIDEMNTIPFASGLYSKEKNLLLCYQLAREVWLHQMIAPVSWVGYLSEPFMLRVLARKYRISATESKSTQKDMERYGFKNVHTFRVGMALTPLTSLGTKKKSNIILSLGSVRPMKRTLHTVKAFEVARDKDPQLRLVVAGDTSTPYAQKVLEYIQNSRHHEAIEVLGRIPAQKRLELMRKADVIVVSSLKEGWGLIVTEANSQGTPAIGYDTDGLRDSIQDGVTGLLCPDGDYEAMGGYIIEILADTDKYTSMRTAAWQWSKEFTFDNSYKDFLEIITRAMSSTSDK